MVTFTSQLVYTSLQGVFTVVTFAINLIVLLALTFSRHQPLTRTFAMTLTVSLVMADLLISVTVMPMSAYYTAIDETLPLGPMMCRLFRFMDVILCTASILHLTGLACDRYLAICRPFVHRRLTSDKAKLVCCLLWLLSAVVALPTLFLQARPVNTMSAGHTYEMEMTTQKTPDICVEQNSSPCLILPGSDRSLSRTNNSSTLEFKDNVMPDTNHGTNIVNSGINGSRRGDRISGSRRNGIKISPNIETHVGPKACSDADLSTGGGLCENVTIHSALNTTNPSKTLQEECSASRCETNATLVFVCSDHNYFTKEVNIISVFMSFILPLILIMTFHFVILRELHSTNSLLDSSGQPAHDVNLSTFTTPAYGGVSTGSHVTSTAADAIERKRPVFKITENDTISLSGESNDRKSNPPSDEWLDTTCTTSSDPKSNPRDVNESRHSHERDVSTKGFQEARTQGKPGNSQMLEAQIYDNGHADCLKPTQRKKHYLKPTLLSSSTLSVNRLTDANWKGSGLQLNSAPHHKARNRSDQAIKTVLCLVLCFVICWAPFFAVILASSFYDVVVSYDVNLLVTWLGYVNSGLNPFLYYRFNRTIRSAIRRFVRL